MTPELKYLTWTAVLTALLWIPYVLNVIVRNGLTTAVGYPPSLSLSPWAERLKKAHYNAVENLAVFASLVLVANALDLSNNATTSAAAAYFWARLVHPVAYTLGIPWVRTLAFAVAWGGILCIAWQVIAQP
jgi:uncharacterized MAPEG superfamily protein